MMPKLIRLVVCSPCSSLSSGKVDLDGSAASPAVRTPPPFAAMDELVCVLPPAFCARVAVVRLMNHSLAASDNYYFG